MKKLGVAGFSSFQAVAANQAVQAVLQATVADGQHRSIRFQDSIGDEKVARLIEAALKKIAHQLCAANMSFTDYMHRPPLMVKRDLRNAVELFYNLLDNYELASMGTARGQQLLMQMDRPLNHYFSTQAAIAGRSLFANGTVAISG